MVAALTLAGKGLAPMTKLTPAHLAPLTKAFADAVVAGEIPLDDAIAFVERTEATVLEQRARVHHNADKRAARAPDNPPRRK